MTTADAIHATEVIHNAASLAQDIPLSRIQESKTNPGRQFDGTRLSEVPKMSTPEINHFLLVCALVSDLYCPGYNPGQALAKDTNLARTAIRYKINIPQVAAQVRNELSRKDKPGKNAPKPSVSPLRE